MEYLLQEYQTNAEEMRHNLLQIYHKLGKSFDVGDIANRFSYVFSNQQIISNKFNRKNFINSTVQHNIPDRIAMMVMILGFHSVIPVHRNFK